MGERKEQGDKNTFSYLRRLLYKEFRDLFTRIDPSVEHAFILAQESGLMAQRAIITIINLLLVSFIVETYFFDTNSPSLRLMLWTAGASLLSVILYCLLQKWSHKGLVKKILLCVSYIPVIMWLFDRFSLIEHDLDLPIKVHIEMIMRTSIMHLVINTILSHQPINTALFCLIIERQFAALSTLFSITNLNPSPTHVGICYRLLFLWFVVYLQKHTRLRSYWKLRTANIELQEVAKVLNIVSDSPIYVIKLTPISRLEMSEFDESLDHEERFSDLSITLALSPVEIHWRHNTEKNLQRTTGASAMAEFQNIYFDSNSRVIATMNKRPISLEDIEKTSPKNRYVTKILKEIINRNYDRHTVPDIILDMYRVLYEYSLIHFEYQFSLQNLNNNELMDPNQYRVYDVDIMFLAEGSRGTIVLVKRDITERVVVDKLEEKGIEMDRSLNTITHDMRAPLHAILGYTEILEFKLKQGSGLLDDLLEENATNIKRIRANCEHLNSMVSDILDSARIANGKFSLNTSEFDVCALARECIDIARTIQENNKFVTLRYSGPKKLLITSDQSRMKRIFLNLLSNGVKYTDLGTVQIEVSHANHLLKISVSDTGRGMDLRAKKNLFHTYFTNAAASSPTVSPNAGIGLGLTSTKYLVERLGPYSEIEVESEASQGSRFTFFVYTDMNNPDNAKLDTLFQKVYKPKPVGFTSIHPHEEGSHKTLTELRSNSNGKFSSIFKPVQGSSFKSVQNSFKSIKTMAVSGSKKKVQISRASGTLRDHFHHTSDEGDDTDRDAMDTARQKLNALHSHRHEPMRTLTKVEEQLKDLAFVKSLPGGTSDCTDTVDKNSSNKHVVTILILDDESFNRDILHMYLDRFASYDPWKDLISFELELKSTVAEAMVLISKCNDEGKAIDLIMTDYHLNENEVTGADFARMVKKMYFEKKLLYPSFFLVSARTPDPEEASLFYKTIQKPFSYESFSNELSKWLHYRLGYKV